MRKVHVYALLIICILVLAVVCIRMQKGSPTLYRVGQMEADGSVALTEEFSPSGVRVSQVEDRECADRLASFARHSRLRGKKLSHQKRSGSFQNLENGVYLLTGAGEEALLLQVSYHGEGSTTESRGNPWLEMLLPGLAAAAFVFSATGLGLCIYLEKCHPQGTCL